MAIIGIDLGATNSLACIYRDGRAELDALEAELAADSFDEMFWGGGQEGDAEEPDNGLTE